MPKNKPKEAYLVPAPKARLHPKVIIAKCLPGGAEGPYQGQPLSPQKRFKNVLGTRLEGTFECKARLENPVQSWSLEVRQEPVFLACEVLMSNLLLEFCLLINSAKT